MKLTRVHVENFRNYWELDIELDGDVVIVEENRVGKSNLLLPQADRAVPGRSTDLEPSAGRIEPFNIGGESVDCEVRAREVGIIE